MTVLSTLLRKQLESSQRFFVWFVLFRLGSISSVSLYSLFGLCFSGWDQYQVFRFAQLNHVTEHDIQAKLEMI